jgi:pyridine nucleotide-disulfide oxidoreductase family protein
MTTHPRREIVLWGVGHTHLHVVRSWLDAPMPGARLTCVSDFPQASYSGMLPGVLAGSYDRTEMEIDLAGLCAGAGVSLVLGEVVGLDLRGRTLAVAGRPPLPFEALSIGIGSEPTRRGVEFAAGVVAIKPIQTFLDRLDARLGRLGARPGGGPIRVVVVGGGAGGVEVAFCLPGRIRARLGDLPIELTLVDAHDRPGGLLPATARRVRRALEARGVRLATGRRVARVDGDGVVLDDGDRLAAGLVLWATGARGREVLAWSGLPRDDRGFLRTRPTLQSTADDRIFVVGDAGTIDGAPAPKAGVQAVRQGPVLRENLAALLEGRRLAAYRPRRRPLKLLNTGDGRAIGEFAGLSFEGRWCWSWKDAIDRRFVARYRMASPTSVVSRSTPLPGPPPQG